MRAQFRIKMVQMWTLSCYVGASSAPFLQVARPQEVLSRSDSGPGRVRVPQDLKLKLIWVLCSSSCRPCRLEKVKSSRVARRDEGRKLVLSREIKFQSCRGFSRTRLPAALSQSCPFPPPRTVRLGTGRREVTASINVDPSLVLFQSNNWI